MVREKNKKMATVDHHQEKTTPPNATRKARENLMFEKRLVGCHILKRAP